MTTKLFLDTEFTGLHQNTTLISLALIAEPGNLGHRDEFYAEFTDYAEEQVDPWIKEHVLNNLLLGKEEANTIMYLKEIGRIVEGPLYHVKGDKKFIGQRLEAWLLARDPKLEVWSDTLAYDWLLFCQLFGGALNLPKNVYYIPFDLSTVFKLLGIDPDVSREEFANLQDDLPQHNALHDARVQLACYRKLAAIPTVNSHLQLNL